MTECLTKGQGVLAQFPFDNKEGPSKLLPAFDGVVAQLVEHHNGIVGVRGSNPLGSTILNHLVTAARVPSGGCECSHPANPGRKAADAPVPLSRGGAANVLPTLELHVRTDTVRAFSFSFPKSS